MAAVSCAAFTIVAIPLNEIRKIRAALLLAMTELEAQGHNKERSLDYDLLNMATTCRKALKYLNDAIEQ